jgi:hypothetical protein
MEMRFAVPEYPSAIVGLLSGVVAPRLREGEDLGDVLVGSSKLAFRRSSLLQREALPVDMEYALAMWCWWPFKPELSDQAVELLCRLRAELFAGAAASPASDRLDEVPDDALVLNIEELYESQRVGEWPYAHLGLSA